MASTGDTLYAAMLRAQMAQAEQGWIQAEREREAQTSRNDQSFEQMARVFDLLQKAQAEEHKRKLDIAKLAGSTGSALPTDLVGKPAYEQTQQQYGNVENVKRAEALAALKRQAQEKSDERAFKIGLEGLKGEISQQNKIGIKDYEFSKGREVGSRVVPTWLRDLDSAGSGRSSPSWSQSVSAQRQAASNIVKFTRDSLNKLRQQDKDLGRPVSKNVEEAEAALTRLNNEAQAMAMRGMLDEKATEAAANEILQKASSKSGASSLAEAYKAAMRAQQQGGNIQ